MLIMDEPTNYLDRESLGALALAIKEWSGECCCGHLWSSVTRPVTVDPILIPTYLQVALWSSVTMLSSLGPCAMRHGQWQMGD